MLQFITILTLFTWQTYAQCSVPSGASPETCTTSGQMVTQSETLECDVDYDCCLCTMLSCTNCEKFVADGLNAASDTTIMLTGDTDDGVEIECTGEMGCAGSTITATNVKAIKCDGRESCTGATVDAVCVVDEPCKIECNGAMSCVNATFVLENVEEIKCDAMACEGATFTVTNAVDDFLLSCDAQLACEDATVTVTVTDPEAGIEEIKCGDVRGCQGLSLTMITALSDPVHVESIDCGGEFSCVNATFTTTGLFDVEECFCSTTGCIGVTTNFVCEEGALESDGSGSGSGSGGSGSGSGGSGSGTGTGDDDDDVSADAKFAALNNDEGADNDALPAAENETITITFSNSMLINLWALAAGCLAMYALACACMHKSKLSNKVTFN